MGGGPISFNTLVTQTPKFKWFTKLFGATTWFFIMYRFYHDGGHHFLGQHPWEKPEMVEYLKKVDEKYGSSLATDNMHHHH